MGLNTQHTSSQRQFLSIWNIEKETSDTSRFPRHIQEAINTKDVDTLFKIKARVQVIFAEAEAGRNYSPRSEKNYHEVSDELRTVKRAIDTVMGIEKRTLH